MKHFEKVAEKRGYIDISPLLSFDWNVAKISVNEVYVAKRDDAFAATKLYITTRGRIVQFRHCPHTAPSRAVGGGLLVMLMPRGLTSMYPYLEALTALNVPKSRRVAFTRTYFREIQKRVAEYLEKRQQTVDK